VVVSNFTSHLDCAELLLRGMGAMEGSSCLRIDGSVPSDSRQALIDRFNSPRDSSFVFLLSSRAGGVGISLIGASRLVMLDADWNPAVDHQAMARIWREGQKRPVFIYRLIAAGSIEQSILEVRRSVPVLVT
jgi:DNA repair and recombination protein RAD54B